MMRWSKGGRHEGLNMLGLAIRVRTTTERSPGSLVRISVTMAGLQQLQLLPKPVWPCKLFMSRKSVNRCNESGTTLSVQEYDRRERAG